MVIGASRDGVCWVVLWQGREYIVVVVMREGVWYIVLAVVRVAYVVRDGQVEGVVAMWLNVLMVVYCLLHNIMMNM